MTGELLSGRVVVVTGAGRGLGRSHALELASEGARVVVNDRGVEADGTGGDPEPARLVAESILAAGGEAVHSADDVASWKGAARVLELALSAFGTLDAVVNNAGIVRDEPFVQLGEADFDEVVRVHLKGQVALASQAAAYWRELANATGPSDWRIVNTTSPVALAGKPGQSAHVAAKAAVAALTVATAAELSRYGVTVNAIAPAARTRLMNEEAPEGSSPPPDGRSFDALDPANVSPLVAWLCSSESRGVTGRVFEVAGGRVSIMQGWRRAASFDRGDRLVASQLRPVIDGLIAQTG